MVSRLLETGVIPRDTPADSVFANIFTWVWLMTFIGYGRAHLSFGNRFIAWARDASYPVYILHQTVIIVIAYFVIRQPWSPWTKYGVVLTSTLISCVLLYEFLLSVSRVLRVMFGIKMHASALIRASRAGRRVSAERQRLTGARALDRRGNPPYTTHRGTSGGRGAPPPREKWATGRREPHSQPC